MIECERCRALLTLPARDSHLAYMSAVNPEHVHSSGPGAVTGIDCPVTSDGALVLARLVLGWAAQPRDHGGNPYMLDFVKAARRILGDE